MDIIAITIVKNLLEFEYSNIKKIKVGEIPTEIRVYPWDCALGGRLDSLELRKWSAERGWEYLALPCETKQVNAWGRNGEELGDCEFFTRQWFNDEFHMDEGVYALIHMTRLGDWEVPDDPDYKWVKKYEAWVWEV